MASGLKFCLRQFFVVDPQKVQQVIFFQIRLTVLILKFLVIEILFHLDLNIFKGGFLGVDVFFVISGYLITSLILSEKEAGTFTLISFYERRARRILLF